MTLCARDSLTVEFRPLYCLVLLLWRGQRSWPVILQPLRAQEWGAKQLILLQFWRHLQWEYFLVDWRWLLFKKTEAREEVLGILDLHRFHHQLTN